MSSSYLSVADFRTFLSGNMRPGVAVHTFSHSDQMFPSREVRRAGPVRVLSARRQPLADVRFEQEGRGFDLNDFLATNRVAGLLVLKDGDVALESYELGIAPETRWASCSMAKSVLSMLVGVAVREGAIRSLDDLASRYVPMLASGAYEQVTVRHLLTMTTAVSWDETYTNPESDRRRLLECQMTLRPGAVIRHMSSLRRAGPPGSIWKYNTGDSYVLGAVMEAAIGGSLVDYLSEKIWAPGGMERDATWWLDSPGGMAVAGSGMSATLRDYGRFGQIVLEGGRVNGKQIVPENWVAEGGVPQIVSGSPVPYGYQWWIPPQSEPLHVGAFQAEGVFGQYIYVHPRERVVIVLLSARSKPSVVSRVELIDETFFAAVVRALQ
ncbi:serine hydrolase domain-containing protein [Peristeroidobacter soli]|jgi:CubicO group peptidase (beta-lactamase class C family)|uniref:serine hydrolase domain-containing protein n=1 Tax=Peristeroidobacter soli TaxID=2497877 RepID=UPI00101C17E5|nr:serine hydrolase [Peristeroidobacter soli]